MLVNAVLRQITNERLIFVSVATAVGGYAEKIFKTSDVCGALIKAVEQPENGKPIFFGFMIKEKLVLPMANNWGR